MTTQLDPEIGTLTRDGVTVFYVTINRETGETIEALHPAELPAAEEVIRLQHTAKVRTILQDTLAELADDLAGPVLGFHLVTQSLMCVVWDHSGPGFRLGSLCVSKGRPFTAKTQQVAEAKACLWNGQLTADQAALGCKVEVLTRRAALDALAVQTQGLLDALNDRA